MICSCLSEISLWPFSSNDREPFLFQVEISTKFELLRQMKITIILLKIESKFLIISHSEMRIKWENYYSEYNNCLEYCFYFIINKT